MTTVPMSVQDSLWLTTDRPNNLMVVDGAMTLRGVPTDEAISELFTRTVEHFPVLARTPVRSGLGWAWQDDPDFDVSEHVDRVDLDTPMTMRGLQDFLAEQRATPLPKDRPLWRAFIIAPLVLPDGTHGSAVVSRFHHAIADGVRLTQVLLGMCETDDLGVEAVVSRKAASREGESDHGDSAMAGAIGAAGDAANAVAHGVGNIVGGATHAVLHPVQAVSDAPHQVAGAIRTGQQGLGMGIDLVRHPDKMLDALEVLGIDNNRGTNDLSSVTKLALAGSEETVWTGEPGTVKAIAWSEQIPLDSIKAVGRAAGATVNDVLLASIAGGLRRYLGERGTSVDEVIWMVPVNLKPFEDNLPPDLGNYFALVFMPMPLDTEDPAERLAQMHHRMARIKNSDEAVLTFGLQRIVSLSPTQVATFLTNFFANKAVGVLTNVPGPAGPMTFAGVEVDQLVGFAPCSGNQPMTATIFSYNGGVTVGFATDAGLVPDPEVLAAHVVDDLSAMGVEVG